MCPEWDPRQQGTKFQVDGGGVEDTLGLSVGEVELDLSAIAERVYTGIERIDLTDGDDSLTVGLRNLLELSVRGDGGDIVNAVGLSRRSGTFMDDGVTYEQYAVAGTPALLNIDQCMTLNLL